MLGDEALLASATDRSRRVTVLAAGEIVGVGCYVRVYGPVAEIALALRDEDADDVAVQLVDGLATLAGRAGVRTLRAVLDHGQEHFADRLPGMRKADVWQLPAAQISVASPEHNGHEATLPGLTLERTLIS